MSIQTNKKNPTSDGLLVIWNLRDYRPYELFFDLAQGYIHAASVMFEEQRISGEPSYFDLLPGMFSLSHSIECFLKAAILLGDASMTVEKLTSPSLGHNLKKLCKKYRQIYPSSHFKLPDRVEQLIQWTDTVAQGKGGVFERYLLDTVGRLIKQTGTDSVPIDNTLDLISALTQDFRRLEQDIMNAKGISVRNRPDQVYSSFE
jgi:hypothetical protein